MCPSVSLPTPTLERVSVQFPPGPPSASVAPFSRSPRPLSRLELSGAVSVRFAPPVPAGSVLAALCGESAFLARKLCIYVGEGLGSVGVRNG